MKCVPGLRAGTSKSMLQKYNGALTILYPFFKSNTLTQRIKVTLYMALIRSMLLYGCEAWSVLDKYHKKKIQILQNKCLKIIFQAPRFTRISELHYVANLPYIDELMEDWVHKMFHMISTHDNTLVQTVGHVYQWRVTHRNIFQGLCDSEDAQLR